MKNHLALLCLFLLGTGHVSAQYGLSIAAGYTFGFNTKAITLQGVALEENATHGFTVDAVNQYTFNNSRFVPFAKVGIKQLFLSGSLAQIDYTGQTFKVFGGIGSYFRFSQKSKLGLCFEIENNLDAEKLRTLTDDNFRYSVYLDYSHNITKHLALYVGYYHGLDPITDGYIINNPTEQFRLGLSYQIL